MTDEIEENLNQAHVDYMNAFSAAVNNIIFEYKDLFGGYKGALDFACDVMMAEMCIRNNMSMDKELFNYRPVEALEFQYNAFRENEKGGEGEKIS